MESPHDDLNLRIQYAWGRLQPYGFLGAGFTRSALSSSLLPGVEETFWGFALRGEGGLNFYLTEHVGVAAEASFVKPYGDNEGLDYVSIGIGAFYRF